MGKIRIPECLLASDQPGRRRPLHKTVETEDCQEDAERHPHVGGDQGTVGDDVRLEDNQDQGQKSRACSPHGMRCEKDRQCQRKGQQRRGQPRTQQHRVRVIGIQELASADEFDGFEVALRPRRRAQVEGQQWHRRHQLDQRRMLGIDAEVEILPVAIAGKDMTCLIKGLRHAAGGNR